VVVEEYAGTITDREYVEGVRWDSGLISSDFVTSSARQEAVMADPVIALANLEITSAAQVVPMLQQALQAGAKSLVVIAWNIRKEALGTLLLNKDKLAIAPIKAPGLVLSRPEILKDLAILTGATLIDAKAGRRMEEYHAGDFGRARRVVATRSNFTVIGALGRERDIRNRIGALKGELAQEQPTAQSDMLRRRLANLSGGMAILKIGAISQGEGKLKRRLAEDTIRAVRAALEEGTLPGGGAAYLACIPALDALAKATENEDQAAGVRIIANALAAPLQEIASNGGYPGPTITAKARQSSAGFGFDVLSGQVVDMRKAGILDPAKVLRVALEMAASTAAMLLTTDVVVLTKRERIQDVALEP
jgi:chaperonin GroEL